MADKEYIERKAALLAITNDGCSVSNVGALMGVPTADVVEVRHGHKVVRLRGRGIAYQIKCATCGGNVPSNEPYCEHVEYCSECGKKLDDVWQNYCPACGAKMYGTEIIGDNLIAHGVTVQEWISVKDRLPDNEQWVVCIMYDGSFRAFQWDYIDWMWNDGNEWYAEKDVTHWMPLPQPPKGE